MEFIILVIDFIFIVYVYFNNETNSTSVHNEKMPLEGQFHNEYKTSRTITLLKILENDNLPYTIKYLLDDLENGHLKCMI